MTACGVCHREIRDGYVCKPCRDDFAALLRELAWQGEELRTTATRQDAHGQPGTGGRSGDDEQPLAFNVRASELYDEIRSDLSRWHTILTPSATIAFDWPLDRFALSLAHNVNEIARSEQAGPAYTSIKAASVAAVRSINRPEPLVYRGPCPGVSVDVSGQSEPVVCGEALWNRRDAEYVTCGRCGECFEAAAVERRTLDEIGRYLLTIPEALLILRSLGERVPRQTVHNWRRQGRLAPRGWLHAGYIYPAQQAAEDVPVFRLDDLRALKRTNRQNESSDCVHSADQRICSSQ